MENTITEQKLKRYLSLTQKALGIAKTKVVKGKEREANEIIDMVENYLSDAEHFKQNKDFVNAFAAINYAHGWLDSGARLKIFNVKDNQLFTI